MTHGDQEAAREERFKLVSGIGTFIVRALWELNTIFSNAGRWKHADWLILMENGLQAFCHRL